MKQHNRNIVLIGMPGSGKTSIGKILAKRLRMNFCDVDQYIENKEGKTIKQIFIDGEKHFRKLESTAVEKLSNNIDTVISTGGGVVLNYKNMYFLKQNGIVFFINRPIEDIVKDIDISGRPLLANDNKKIYRIFEERYGLYTKYSDFEIHSNKGILDTAEQIIKTLEENNP